MNKIELIKKIWKTGMVSVVVATMVFGGLFLNLKAASATGNPAPNLTIKHLAIGTGSNWDHNVTLNPGDEVDFYAEIHNTVVGSVADNVALKVNLTGGTFTDGTSVATAKADNSNSATDTVNIHINGGGKLEYIANSTNVTWDVDGDGNKEYNNTFVAGNPFDGLRIGDQKGCNQYIIQVGWAARVVGNPASPTPTPVASPTPTPPAGGNNQQQQQNQEQTQNNNQSVNVTNTNNNTVNVPQVAGVSTPAKTPETGVSVLGMASMFGAGPVGLALSRFGKGRVLKGKKEENLAEIANDLVNNRLGKSKDA